MQVHQHCLQCCLLCARARTTPNVLAGSNTIPPWAASQQLLAAVCRSPWYVCLHHMSGHQLADAVWHLACCAAQCTHLPALLRLTAAAVVPLAIPILTLRPLNSK